ncbi:MAG: hypothetical protein AB2L12_00180 [Smithellaceae bacterium]
MKRIQTGQLVNHYRWDDHIHFKKNCRQLPPNVIQKVRQVPAGKKSYPVSKLKIIASF